MSFRKVKKNNGEGFAKVIRNYHNGIFEVPNLLRIVKHAGRTSESAESIMGYLMSLLVEEDKEPDEIIKDPLVLLSQAGYDAYYADTRAKQDSIKKHFEKDEELCTFREDRFKHYYIINAVKKDVAEIRRKNFVGKESREDEYGTSVISIQVAKKGGFISIKNRYNHKVANCDNTFRSNPDNIIPGLSSAIQEHFKVSFSTKNNLVPDGYILVDGSMIKYHSEIGGIYYGDHAYVKDGALHEVLAVEHDYLFDVFIFNSRTKMFREVKENETDCFAKEFNKVYGGLKTLHVKNHCIYDGEEMLVGV